MKFGIVTPLRNARATFKACASSLKAQSNDGHDFSVVHVVRESDSSSENCADLAAQFDCRYTCAPDHGLYEAIQSGLDEACASGADIVGWLNADEQYLPGTLDAVARLFASSPSIGLVFGDYLLINEQGSVLSARREIPARLFYLRQGVNYLLSCTVFFRSDVWKKAGGFDLSYRFLADKKFFLNVLSSGIKTAHIPRYLGAFGVTGHNESLNPATASEQARLRAETGAFASPIARKLVRSCRCSEKLLRGCYGSRDLSATVFSPDGTPQEFRGRVPATWRWS